LAASVNGTFHRCIDLINSGHVSRAKAVLALDVIHTHSEDVKVWALMAHLADDRAEEIRCLEQLLFLQPENMWAKWRLLNLRNRGSNGGKPSGAMTRPFRLSAREILWESEGSSSSWSMLQARGFGTSKRLSGWGIIPESQGTWPTGLRFRSLKIPFSEKVEKLGKPHGWRRTFRGIIDAFLLLVIVSALVLFLVPELMGAHLLVVVGRSMEPTVPMGSIVVSFPETNPDHISVGDVITFTAEGPGVEAVLITHRVVEVVDRGAMPWFRTKGDAAEVPDQVLVTPDHLIGRLWFSLPLVGYLVAFLRTPLGYMTIVGFPTSMFIVREWWEIRRTTHKRETRQLAVASVWRRARTASLWGDIVKAPLV
jgi:signal peptidase